MYVNSRMEKTASIHTTVQDAPAAFSACPTPAMLLSVYVPACFESVPLAYIYIYMSVCVQVCVYVYAHTKCMYVCVHMYECINVCMPALLQPCFSLCMFLRAPSRSRWPVYMYVCVYVCMYIYIYIYIYIHTQCIYVCVYMYECINVCMPALLQPCFCLCMFLRAPSRSRWPICMYVCVYVCMYVYTHPKCMYVCVYMYECVNV